MTNLAATLARLEAAVCLLDEVHDRINKAEVVRLIRAEMPAIPVPRKSQEESHV